MQGVGRGISNEKKSFWILPPNPPILASPCRQLLARDIWSRDDPCRDGNPGRGGLSLLNHADLEEVP
jgi:hypothetical protein